MTVSVCGVVVMRDSEDTAMMTSLAHQRSRWAQRRHGAGSRMIARLTFIKQRYMESSSYKVIEMSGHQPNRTSQSGHGIEFTSLVEAPSGVIQASLWDL